MRRGITKALKGADDYGIMTVSNTNSGGGVNYICKIDERIYECVSNDIPTDEVVITDKQIEHSNLHKGLTRSIMSTLNRRCVP